MIILDKFIDLIEVIRIKMIAFNAEMSLDRFSRVALYQRSFWRLCLRGAKFYNRADP